MGQQTHYCSQLSTTLCKKLSFKYSRQIAVQKYWSGMALSRRVVLLPISVLDLIVVFMNHFKTTKQTANKSE